jgi:hypothetical protein
MLFILNGKKSRYRIKETKGNYKTLPPVVPLY